MLAPDRLAAGAAIHESPSGSVCRVVGADALDLLSRLASQELAPLSEGRAVTTLFLDGSGKPLLRVALQPDEGGFRAFVEQLGEHSLAPWLDRYTFAEDCRVEEPPEWSCAWLLGRAAPEIAAEGLDSEGACAALDGLVVSRHAFGPLPLCLATGPGAALSSWLADCRERGAEALDAASFEQLRVAAGVPAAGAELTGERHALESGLRADVSFDKGCYPGQEVVARQDTYDKVIRTLVGLRFGEAPSVGDELSSEEKKGCEVTSVAPAADEDGGWSALGFVRTRNAVDEHAVTTSSGLEGRVVLLPFPSLRG